MVSGLGVRGLEFRCLGFKKFRVQGSGFRDYVAAQATPTLTPNPIP